MTTADWRNERHHKLAGVEMDHDETCPVCRKYLETTPWVERDQAWFEKQIREQAQQKHDQ